MRLLTGRPAPNFVDRLAQMRRLMRRLSRVIGISIALAIPAGYFTAGYIAQVADLTFKAQLNAERLARHAYAYGPTWHYGAEHLVEIIALTNASNVAVRQRVTNERGELVVETAGEIAPPLIWQSRPILVRESVAGTVAVGASLRPLIFDTGFVGLLGILLGTLAWLAMHRLPERSLAESLEELRQAHEETARHAESTAAAYDELQRQYRIVEETTQELMRARDDAMSADRSKSAFLATMSHELRTPLNAIIGFSDMMRSRILGEFGNDQYDEYIEDIHESGQHLLSIVNDILDLSKIEAGRMKLHVEPLCPAELILDCQRLMGAKVEEAGIELSIGPSSEPVPTIMADAVKLKQIILNLLSNAVKFTQPGGRVTISAVRINDLQIEVTVADTGIGMAETDIAVAMKPFQQVDNTISRRFEGTGLGLPLARALAEQHGGRLGLHSVVGEGTTVTITLPIYGPPEYRDRNAGPPQTMTVVDLSDLPDSATTATAPEDMIA